MVEIPTSGSGEGLGWETGPGYSTVDGLPMGDTSIAAHRGYLSKPSFNAGSRGLRWWPAADAYVIQVSHGVSDWLELL